MSISKKLMFTAASLLTAASLFNLGAEMPAEMPAPVAIEDLQKAALAFQAADNAMKSTDEGKYCLECRKVFYMRVAKCNKDEEKIVKSVEKAIEKPKKFLDKEEAETIDEETLAFAKGEVMKKVENILARREKDQNEEEKSSCRKNGCRFGLVQPAREFCASLVKVDRSLYAQYEQASSAFRQMVKTLLNQGVTRETIKEEMEKAGVQHPMVMRKTDRETKNV